MALITLDSFTKRLPMLFNAPGLTYPPPKDSRRRAMFALHITKAQTKAVANSTYQSSTRVVKPHGHGALEQVNMLQRSIGNQAIRSAFAAGDDEHEQELDSAALGCATALGS